MRAAIIFSALLPVALFGQQRSTVDTAQAVAALLSEGAGAAPCFDDSAVAASNRLGITYEGVSRKSLISYDLEEPVKARLRSKELEYTTSWNTCGRDIEHLTLTIPKLGISRDIYFRNGCLSSPFYCLTEGWTTRSSRFFSFVLSDSTDTNPAAIDTLDKFVLHTGAELGLSDADFANLERRKILYYLCSDEDEIQRLTGFKTRGIYNLAYDAIVSTYNTHYHELTHLLVNFKLRHAKLFVHPFLQEGLAVALGGRGGLSADVVVDLGAFLDETEMLRYPALIRRSDFNSHDASLSYPAAGLYNRFLLESLGVERYLDLYSRHCGVPGDSSIESITIAELPPHAEWEKYLSRHKAERPVEFGEPGPPDRIVWRSEGSAIDEHRARLQFSIRRALLFGPCDTAHVLRSAKFSELFPESPYPGHRYAALADSQSVSVYDLWTNTLIASYNAAFDVSPVSVPQQKSGYTFSVEKSLFSDSAVDPRCSPVEMATGH